MNRVILSTRHPGRSHWRLIGSIVAFVLAFFLTACGDDDSDFITRDDESSSGVEEDSSSSVKDVILSGDSREGSSPSSSSSIASSNSAKSSSSKAPEPGEGNLMDTRDGQTYRTVTIGTQIWMAENLNYETVDSYCYNDSAEYCAKYGRLYTWAAAMDSVRTGCGYGSICSPTMPVQGICPMGWHLPNYDEWKTLIGAVGGSNIAGKKLKSSSGWNDNDGASGNGTDAFGFAALPAGEKEYYGNYFSEGDIAYFWSSSIYGSDGAYSMRLFVSGNVYVVSTDKRPWYSVRCLKDDSDTSVTPQSSEGETSVSSSSSAKSSSSVAYEEPCRTDSTETCEYGTLIDTRDGQTYKTVTIGSQTWMAENLNYAYTGVPFNYDRYTSDSTSWCTQDDTSKCSMYGRLYTWAAAMDSVGMWSTNGKGCGFSKTCVPTYPMRGICPEGWHLPMQAEWNALFTTVGGSSIAGKMLKSTSFWSGEARGSDAYAFSALPAGDRDYGIFLNERSRAHFWSSTESGNYDAYSLNLYYGDNADLSLYSKYYGLSVRCLKD